MQELPKCRSGEQCLVLLLIERLKALTEERLPYEQTSFRKCWEYVRHAYITPYDHCKAARRKDNLILLYRLSTRRMATANKTCVSGKN